LEAVIEALEHLRVAVETQAQHVARMDLSLGAIEDTVKVLANRR
jgi:hypothetical protein